MADDLVPLSVLRQQAAPVAAANAAAPQDDLVTLDQLRPPPPPPPPPAAPTPAQPGTLGYVGTRTLGGLLDLGRAGATEADLFAKSAQTGQEDPTAQAVLNTPPGQVQAPRMIYGADQMLAPNPVARYAGAVGQAVGENPAVSLLTPGYTAASALSGEGASDLNKATGAGYPDWLVRLFGNLVGGGGYGVAKAGVGALTTPATNPVKDLAASSGPQVSRIQAAQTIQQKALDWIDGKVTSAGRDFDAIEGQFPPGARADLPATSKLLSVPNEGPPLPELAGKLKAQLDQNGGTLPYAMMKEWRTAIGKSMGNDPRLGDTYGALTKDMEDAIRAQETTRQSALGVDPVTGEKAVDAAVSSFRSTNSAYKAFREFVENRLGKLGDPTLPPERLTSLVNNPAAHTTELTDLLNAGVIDRSDVGGIARSWLEKSSRNSDGYWDPNTLGKNLAKLQRESPETEALLFRGTPEDSARFDQMSRAAGFDPNAVDRLAPGKPGIIRKLVPAAIGAAAGHATGLPGAGEGFAGYFLGHGQANRPVYSIPGQPPLASMLTRGVAPPLLNGPRLPQQGQ